MIHSTNQKSKVVRKNNFFKKPDQNRMVLDNKINGYPNPKNEIQILLTGLAK